MEAWALVSRFALKHNVLDPDSFSDVYLARDIGK